MMSPVRVRTSWSAIRAIPKSVSFAVPSPASASGQMTFEGLTSRWMTPRLWAWASAAQSVAPTRSTSRSDSAPSRSSSASVGPSTSSETR